MQLKPVHLFPSSSLFSACLPVSDSSCAGMLLAGNSVCVDWLSSAWQQRSWELKNQEAAFILSVSCLFLPSQLLRGKCVCVCTYSAYRAIKAGQRGGNNITQREMKNRQSEPESCRRLSKKLLFLPPSVSLSVSLTVLMCSDKPTALWWWNSRADTTQQMKSVSWWLEAHTCCLSYSFPSLTGFSLFPSSVLLSCILLVF